MRRIFKEILIENKFKLALVICIAGFQGTFPVITAKLIAEIIDQKSTYSYSIYFSLILLHTILNRVQESLLQIINRVTFPKVRYRLSKNINNITPIHQDSINKVANFIANTWGIAFIIKNTVLVVSTTILLITSNSIDISIWGSCILSIYCISILWQPKTRNITNRKQKINNKLFKSIRNKKLVKAYIVVNLMTYKIIIKQQVLKTIIICFILSIVTIINWQEFILKHQSIDTTLMILNLNISACEIIWWLQHEISIWQLQLNQAKNALNTLKQA